ncbi:hypothetical protein OB13_11235 [Pontibacter sp. HJ8]
MKALIIGLMSLLVVMAAGYAGSFLLPDACEVTKTVVVEGAPEQVFPYLENPTQWEKWNVWNKDYDPTMIRLYGGPMAGKGAYQQWHGDRLGAVLMHFTESTPPSLLLYKQQIKNEPYETLGTFRLEPAADSTRVIWQQKTRLPENPIARYIGFFKKHTLEQEAEESLQALKSLMEGSDKKKSS